MRGVTAPSSEKGFHIGPQLEPRNLIRINGEKNLKMTVCWRVRNTICEKDVEIELAWTCVEDTTGEVLLEGMDSVVKRGRSRKRWNWNWSQT